MTNQLLSQIATDREADIARTADRRRLLRTTLTGLGARISRRGRPASAGGGMLPLWRHGSPARGS
ncbi:MAG: hypothetical protein QOE86_928 [Solirubrobacteraceae bacterium]|jgi:hypothetical protein|nr:hypothetical protein [Solirubrobacteraceae bacterium]